MDGLVFQGGIAVGEVVAHGRAEAPCRRGVVARLRYEWELCAQTQHAADIPCPRALPNRDSQMFRSRVIVE